jgi:hypothetical protein
MGLQVSYFFCRTKPLKPIMILTLTLKAVLKGPAQSTKSKKKQMQQNFVIKRPLQSDSNMASPNFALLSKSAC